MRQPGLLVLAAVAGHLLGSHSRLVCCQLVRQHHWSAERRDSKHDKVCIYTFIAVVSMYSIDGKLRKYFRAYVTYLGVLVSCRGLDLLAWLLADDVQDAILESLLVL